MCMISTIPKKSIWTKLCPDRESLRPMDQLYIMIAFMFSTMILTKLPSWSAKLPLCLWSWESKGTPPMPPPPGNKALLRDYLPLVSLNKALLGPYFLGGVARIPLIQWSTMIQLWFQSSKSAIALLYRRRTSALVRPWEFFKVKYPSMHGIFSIFTYRYYRNKPFM